MPDRSPGPVTSSDRLPTAVVERPMVPRAGGNVGLVDDEALGLVI